MDNRGARPVARLLARDRAKHLAEPLVHKARNCARGLYQPCARAGGVCNTPCRAVCASKRRKGIQKRRCTSDLYAGS